MSARRINPVTLHAAIGLLLILTPVPALHDVLARRMGDAAVFRTLPVDPWDPFMGRHVILQLDLGTLDCAAIPCEWNPESGDYPEEVHVELDCANGPCQPVRLVEQKSKVADRPHVTLEGWNWRQPDTVIEDSGAPPPPSTQLDYRQTVFYYFDEAGDDPSANLTGESLWVRGHLWKGRFTPQSLERVKAPDQ